MDWRKKVGLIAIIFLVVYASGLGSVVGDSYIGTAEGVTRIAYITESQTEISEQVLITYCNSLMNSFRFDSGASGKIPYFYGGKALNVNPLTGLDTNFGKYTTGYNSSGDSVYKPYGLDCSGFVSYVFWLSGYKTMVEGSVNQKNIGTVLSFPDSADTGDLVFHDDVNGNTDHVGILISTNDGLFVYHCNASDNGIAYDRVVAPITEGNYWEFAVSNPYVIN